MTRTRQHLEWTAWVAIGINSGIVVYDLATGAYHLAGYMAVLVTAQMAARHAVAYLDRRGELALGRMEEDLETAKLMRGHMAKVGGVVVEADPRARAH